LKRRQNSGRPYPDLGGDDLEGVVILDVGVEEVAAVGGEELVGVDPVALEDGQVRGDLPRISDEAGEVVVDRGRRRFEVAVRRAIERAEVCGLAELVDLDDVRKERREYQITSTGEIGVGKVLKGASSRGHRRRTGSDDWRALWLERTGACAGRRDTDPVGSHHYAGVGHAA